MMCGDQIYADMLNRMLPATGYDFLNYVNGLLCDASNEKEFNRIYSRFIGDVITSEHLIDEKQRLIVEKHLAGDIDNLAHLLKPD